jgi:hypothetical protein
MTVIVANGQGRGIEMKPCIVMTSYRRPNYTRRVLDALAVAIGMEEHTLHLFIEPGHIEKFYNMIESYPYSLDVHANETRLGCNANTVQALMFGAKNGDYIVAIEDDTVPDIDALEFMDFGMKLAGISSCYRAPGCSGFDLRATLFQEWFYPWVWAMRSDMVMEYAPQIVIKDPMSWDTQLNHLLKRDGKLLQVCPKAARSQNIGSDEGEHVPSKHWHYQHQFNEDWAGSKKHDPVMRNEFKEPEEGVIGFEVGKPKVFTWRRRPVYLR